MKIGIIVYSQTGNTFAVAEKLKEKLAAAGNAVNIERLTTMGGETDPSKAKLAKLPDLTSYDALVFAAPVQAFSLSRVMAGYLKQLPALNNRKVAVFVTKGLAFNFTGGNKAIARLSSEVGAHGGRVVADGIVHWGKRDAEIPKLTEKIASAF
jgi:NAD(P)H dehydrogenase (quinone)